MNNTALERFRKAIKELKELAESLNQQGHDRKCEASGIFSVVKRIENLTESRQIASKLIELEQIAEDKKMKGEKDEAIGILTATVRIYRHDEILMEVKALLNKKKWNAKQEKLKEAVLIFENSQRTADDYLNFSVVISRVLSQGDGLVWEQVREVFEETLSKRQP